MAKYKLIDAFFITGMSIHLCVEDGTETEYMLTIPYIHIFISTLG